MLASGAGTGTPARPGRTLLVFQIAAELCAIPVESVQEIVPMAALSHSPGQPSVVEGFLNLRGAAVPVVRLNRLFDLPPVEPGLYSPLVILRGVPHPTALLVDRVLEIAGVPSDALLPVDDAQTFNGCVNRQASLGGRTVHVLSTHRLLLERERHVIAEFQAKAQSILDGLEAPPA